MLASRNGVIDLETFAILIIFRDGTEKKVEGVTKYGYIETSDCFRFTKDGFNHFIPKDNILYFGLYNVWHDED